VRPRVAIEANTMPAADERSRSRTTERSMRLEYSGRVPEIPSVRQLQSRFQPDGRSNSIPNNAPQGAKVAASSNSGSVPEIKVQKSGKPEAPSSKTQATASGELAIDPEIYFESTNHSQRFLHTRAIFAKMEEQSLREKERRRQLLQRSKSPTRFPASPPNYLSLSPMVSGLGDPHGSSLSPTSSTDSENRPPVQNRFEFSSRQQTDSLPAYERRASDVNEPRQPPLRASNVADSTPVASRSTRASSVDGLDSDDPFEPLSHTSRAVSRSETNLGPVGGSSDIPSPKWLMQHYEEVTRKSTGSSSVVGPAALGGRRRSRPSTGADDGNTSDASQRDASSAPTKSTYGGGINYNYPSLERRQTANDRADRSASAGAGNYVRQNLPDRIEPAKPAANVKPVSLSSSKVTNTVTDSNAGKPSAPRYGRPADVEQTATSSPPSSSSKSSSTAASEGSSRPSHATSAGTRRDGAVDSTSANVRKSVSDDDDSVSRSMEAWKMRRQIGGDSVRLASKLEELERGLEKKPFETEKPSWVTERGLHSVGATRGNDRSNDQPNSDVAEPQSKSGADIFGVSLRSQSGQLNGITASQVEDKDIASVADVRDEKPSDKSAVNGNVEEQDFMDSEDISARHHEVSAAAAAAGRRRSIDLADVPHFPKDSILLGHSGSHSPAVKSPSAGDEDLENKFTFNDPNELTDRPEEPSLASAVADAPGDLFSGKRVAPDVEPAVPNRTSSLDEYANEAKSELASQLVLIILT
jgi:hypothetical protein